MLPFTALNLNYSGKPWQFKKRIVKLKFPIQAFFSNLHFHQLRNQAFTRLLYDSVSLGAEHYRGIFHSRPQSRLGPLSRRRLGTALGQEWGIFSLSLTGDVG